MVFIYVLKLAHGKYYVGKTESPNFRLNSHFEYGGGSAWTKMHKPVSIVELIPNCDKYDEDKYTQKYMDKYGIQNVRGGSFVSPELDYRTVELLMQRQTATNDLCFVCNKKGHFAKDCDLCSDEEDDLWCSEYCDKDFDDERGCEKREKRCAPKRRPTNKCFRCGREGHYSPDCYAKTHVNGYYL